MMVKAEHINKTATNIGFAIVGRNCKVQRQFFDCPTIAKPQTVGGNFLTMLYCIELKMFLVITELVDNEIKLDNLIHNYGR
ncbi:hypothetical protein EG348_21400 [Chryseobacterium sp. G0201]|nr:hypothetical protein EG348_21400 [Chryseobacterium sp. G0201]